MADIIQDVLFRVKTDATEARNGVAKVGDEAEAATTKTNKLSSAFKGLLPALGAAAIIAGIVKIGKASLEAYDIQAKAEAKVLQTIKSTSGAAGRSLDQLKAQATALQNETLFGDEEILKGATSTLLTFTKVTGEQFDKAQKVVLDLSAAMGTDLQSSALQVGKALNAPVEGMTALSRSGIQFTDEQKKIVKQLVATGRAAEAQEVILSELNTQFGGQAAAQAKVGLGFWTQLKNRIGDASEVLGEYLLKTLGLVKEQEKEQISLEKIRNEMNLSFEVLKKDNFAKGSKILLIKQINEKYGKYLPNLLTEKSTLKEIEEAQKGVNKQLVLKIALLDFEEERTKIIKDQANAVNFLAASQITANQNLANQVNIGNNPMGNSFIAPISAEEEERRFDAINSDADALLEKLKEKYGAIAKLFGMSLDDFFAVNTVEPQVDSSSTIEKEEEVVKTILEIYEGLNSELEKLSEQRDELVKLKSLKPSPEVAKQIQDELTKVGNSIGVINLELLKFGIREIELVTEDLLIPKDSVEDLKEKVKKQIEGTKPIVVKLDVDIEEDSFLNKFVDGFASVSSEIQGLIESLGIEERAQKEIDKLDELIAKQEELVAKSSELADKGNAEQLALEEDRLNTLNIQQEAALKQKEKNAKAEAAINKALALSNGILAITAAAKDGASALVIIPLVIAAIAAGIGTITSLASGFSEGGYTGDGQKNDVAGTVHKGEFVIDKKTTSKLGLKSKSMDEVAEMFNSKKLGINGNGMLIDFAKVNDSIKLNTKLDEVIASNKKIARAIQSNGMNVNINEDGFALRTSKMIQMQSIYNAI
jgi:hypothetical protein